MSYATVFDDEELSSEVYDFVSSQSQLYALLEKHPAIVLPIMNESVSKDDLDRISNFLFSLFNYNGVVITFAYGVSIDPSKYEGKKGPYKHSKGKVTDFLVLTDVFDETNSGNNLRRLVCMAARECGIPYFADVRYKGFESSVTVSVPSEHDETWIPVVTKSLLTMFFQSRIGASSVTKLDLPFTLEYVDTTVEREIALYSLTENTPLIACDIGNHQHTSWKDFPVYKKQQRIVPSDGNASPPE